MHRTVLTFQHRSMPASRFSSKAGHACVVSSWPIIAIMQCGVQQGFRLLCERQLCCLLAGLLAGNPIQVGLLCAALNGTQQLEGLGLPQRLCVLMLFLPRSSHLEASASVCDTNTETVTIAVFHASVSWILLSGACSLLEQQLYSAHDCA